MVPAYSGIMEPTTAPDLHARLAGRLRALRTARGLTLDGLAARSGVSRAMISLVERGESSPTAAVLHRLATGLGVTLASLFADPPHPDASPIARRDDQRVWHDPATGYRRRALSPPGYPAPLALVEVELPAGARAAYETPAARGAPVVHQQLWLLAGAVRVTVGGMPHDLAAGDCLAMRVEAPVLFENPGAAPARYVLAVAVDRPAAGPPDA